MSSRCKYFWRHVPVSSDPECSCRVLGLKLCRDAKVSQQYMELVTFRDDEDIGILNVPVEDFSLVQVFDCSDELSKNHSGDVFGEGREPPLLHYVVLEVAFGQWLCPRCICES